MTVLFIAWFLPTLPRASCALLTRVRDVFSDIGARLQPTVSSDMLNRKAHEFNGHNHWLWQTIVTAMDAMR